MPHLKRVKGVLAFEARQKRSDIMFQVSGFAVYILRIHGAS